MPDTSQSEAAREIDDGPLFSVVYSSMATVPFSEVDLAVLLSASRQSNQLRGLTGLLLYKNGQFMQALEGPASAVRSVLTAIAADARHTGVWVLDEEPIAERRFGSWAMGYRPLSDADVAAAPGWFGSPDALRVHDDSRASELLDWFRDR